MFFGRGAEEEEVREHDLVNALNESFNRKMLGLESKASRIAGAISRSRSDLDDACERFRDLQKDPDTDFTRSSSAAYIREQKKAYTGMLKRIIAFHTCDGSGSTTYDAYYSKMQDTEALLNEILKANTTFKMVLDAYPNDLGAFKRAFSSLENGWRMLRMEIEARGMDIDEYRTLLVRIRELAALADEQNVVNESITDLSKEEPGSARTEEIEKVRAKIGTLKAKGEEIGRKATELNTEMSIILGTIDKPARKHDYLSMHKPKLTPLLASPSQLAQDGRYDEFYRQVGETKEEIEKGVITVKNEGEVRSAINLIMSGRVRAIIDGIEEMRVNREPVENEMHDLERTLAELEGAIRGASERESALNRMRKRLEEISRERDDLRGKISLLFFSYYKRKVKVA